MIIERRKTFTNRAEKLRILASLELIARHVNSHALAIFNRGRWHAFLPGSLRLELLTFDDIRESDAGGCMRSFERTGGGIVAIQLLTASLAIDDVAALTPKSLVAGEIDFLLNDGFREFFGRDVRGAGMGVGQDWREVVRSQAAQKDFLASHGL